MISLSMVRGWVLSCWVHVYRIPISEIVVLEAWPRCCVGIAIDYHTRHLFARSLEWS